MKQILLDTNAYTELCRGSREILSIVQHADVIAFNPVVLAELSAGFALGSKESKNRKLLGEFLHSNRVKIYPITEGTIPFYTRIYVELRQKGKPIPTNDLWIAASALEHGCGICTFDRHFQDILGLIVGESPEDFIF